MVKGFKMISVKESLHNTLKRMCLNEGRTYSAMIERMVDAYNYVNNENEGFR